jgi:hypothetical protein
MTDPKELLEALLAEGADTEDASFEPTAGLPTGVGPIDSSGKALPKGTVLARLPGADGLKAPAEGNALGKTLQGALAGGSRIPATKDPWKAFADGMGGGMSAMAAQRKEAAAAAQARFNLLLKLREMDERRSHQDRTFNLAKERNDIYRTGVSKWGVGGRGRTRNPMSEENTLLTVMKKHRERLDLDNVTLTPEQRAAGEAELKRIEKAYRDYGIGMPQQPAPAAPGPGPSTAPNPSTPDGLIAPPAGPAAPPAPPAAPPAPPPPPVPGSTMDGMEPAPPPPQATPSTPPAPSREDILAQAKDAIGRGAAADSVIGRINERFGLGLTTKDLGI